MDLAAEEEHLVACLQDAENLVQRLTLRLARVREAQQNQSHSHEVDEFPKRKRSDSEENKLVHVDNVHVDNEREFGSQNSVGRSMEDESEPVCVSRRSEEEEEDIRRREEFQQSNATARRESGLTKDRIAMFSGGDPSDPYAAPRLSEARKSDSGSSVRAMSPARVSIHASEGVDNTSKLSLKDRIAMFNKDQ